MKKSVIISVAFCLAFIMTAKAQHSVDSTAAIPPRVIFKQFIETSGLKEQEVKMVIVNFAPGEISAPHRHSISTFGYVLEGELESTFEGKVYHYKTGDAFYEMPDGLHSGTRNISETKPAKLLAFFVGDRGKPFLISEKK